MTSDLNWKGRLKAVKGFDHGIDVIVIGRSILNCSATTALVQATYYSKPVGIESIDQLFRYYHVYRNKGLIKTRNCELVLVTNNELTPEAK